MAERTKCRTFVHKTVYIYRFKPIQWDFPNLLTISLAPDYQNQFSSYCEKLSDPRYEVLLKSTLLLSLLFGKRISICLFLLHVKDYFLKCLYAFTDFPALTSQIYSLLVSPFF